MLHKSIKLQIKIISRQKWFALSIVVIYFFIIINYFKNLHDFYNFDISRMIHPMKMSLLNTYGKWGFYFMQYLPLLLVIPASFSFLKDKDNDTTIYLCSRFGKKNYYYGKIISVFLMTFLAFAVPLFFEYLLNIITFPLNAIGDRTNYPSFDLYYLNLENRYLFSDLWKFNPYLYYFVFVIMFSFVVASFATFALGLSMTPIFKYKILIFLPVYLLMTLFNGLGSVIGIRMNYTDYLMSFDSSEKIEQLYLIISVILLIVTVAVTKWKVSRDM